MRMSCACGSPCLWRSHCWARSWQLLRTPAVGEGGIGGMVCFSTRQQVLLGIVQAGAEAACWVLRCWVLVSSLGECGGMGGLLAPPALPACSPALSISSCEMGGETGLTVRGVPTCILQEAGMWGEEGPLGGCQGLVPAGPPPLPTPCPAFVGISLS